MNNKTKEELENFVKELYPISSNTNQLIEGFERIAFKLGYKTAQQDMKSEIDELKQRSIES